MTEERIHYLPCGEEEPDTGEQLEAHLDQCTICRRELVD